MNDPSEIARRVAAEQLRIQLPHKGECLIAGAALEKALATAYERGVEDGHLVEPD